MSFTDLGEIREFLFLLALVSVYGSNSVYRYVNQGIYLSVHVAILTTAHAQLPHGQLFCLRLPTFNP